MHVRAPALVGAPLMGKLACLYCGNLIDGNMSAAAVREAEYQRELAQDRATRVRARGGLDPADPTTPDICGCGRPKALTSRLCFVCATGR